MSRVTTKHGAVGAPRTVVFGGKVWTVGPLNWEQLARIFPELSQLHAVSPAEQVFNRLRTIIAALDGQASEEELRKLPSDVAEIFIASEVIADLSGFVRLGEHLRGLAPGAMTGSQSKAGPSSSPMPAPAADGHPSKSGS